MKSKNILATAAITLCFGFNSISYSQECHGGGGGGGSHCKKSNSTSSANTETTGVNGGIVKQVGKYNIEMVFLPLMKQDPLMFYLTNKKGKPISNKNIAGKAEITYSDKSTGTITLEPRGDNGFAGQMPNKTGSFICLLTLVVNGENLTARFDRSTATKDNTTAQATYTCPMHPEVTSDKPGQCPKCGMALVRK